jgi:hypothetical protein
MGEGWEGVKNKNRLTMIQETVAFAFSPLSGSMQANA